MTLLCIIRYYTFFNKISIFLGSVKMKNYVNRGKFCNTSGCKHKARVKGFCVDCYREDLIMKKLHVERLHF